MELSESKIVRLLLKVQQGRLTNEEKTYLEDFKKCSQERQQLVDDLTNELNLRQKLRKFEQSLNNKDVVLTKLREKLNFRSQRLARLFYLRKWLFPAAACLLVTLTFIVYQIIEKPASRVYVHATSEDILPGGNKAILTLTDGKRINLSDANAGVLIERSEISIEKTMDGELVYKILSADSTESGKNGVNQQLVLGTNTLSTPSGGQYQIILSDGTKVWLNAASTLRFPTVFNGSQRIVELSGEGYFDVVKSAGKPFIVKTNNVQIKVLGTQFNINSYKDESSIKTTLIKGSVQVNLGYQQCILEPGHETEASNKSLSIPKTADIKSAISWKDGYFHFKNTPLVSVMRQISRWYDVKVVYQGPINTEDFTGEISKNAKASEVLEVLKELGVNFTIKGRRIIVKS
jgi:transmembrane sensor